MNNNNQEITVKIKLFAIYQETYKQPEITVSLPEKTTIQELFKNKIIQEKPELKNWENITRFAVNLNLLHLILSYKIWMKLP